MCSRVRNPEVGPSAYSSCLLPARAISSNVQIPLGGPDQTFSETGSPTSPPTLSGLVRVVEFGTNKTS